MARLPNSPLRLPTVQSFQPKFPITPLPKILGVKIPPRTLTGQIPSTVRDLVRYSGLVEGILRGRSESVKQPPVALGSSQANDWSAYEGGGGAGGTVLRGFLKSQAKLSDILYFQFNPSEVKISHAPGWIISPTPGRSHPFIQYGGAGARKISFQLKLAYTLNDVGNVQDNVNWLHSFLFPSSIADVGTEGFVTAPDSLYLFLGQVIARGEAAHAVPVIMLKADVRYHTIMRAETLSPQFADIDLEFFVMLDTGYAYQKSDEQRSSFGRFDKAARDSRRQEEGTP